MLYPNLDTYERTPDAIDDAELTALMLRELELSNYGQPSADEPRYSELLTSQAQRDALGW
jgi:hypothetical protein